MNVPMDLLAVRCYICNKLAARRTSDQIPVCEGCWVREVEGDKIVSWTGIDYGVDNGSAYDIVMEAPAVSIEEQIAELKRLLTPRPSKPGSYYGVPWP